MLGSVFTEIGLSHQEARIHRELFCGSSMPRVAEAALTRKGLIWWLMEKISTAEGKPIANNGRQQAGLDRDYVLTPLRDVIQAVDGAPRELPAADAP